MIHNILKRAKTLLGITDSSQDEVLFLYLENALYMVRSYIHSQDVSGLEAPITQLVVYLYTSALDGAAEGASSSSSSTSEGGGTSYKTGELKSEHYPGGISWEYTTDADFVSKSSSKSSGASTNASGDAITYFTTYIAPLLRSRRKIMTISHPLVETSPERY